MEQKRCFHTVIRETVALLSSNPATLHRPLKVPPSLPNQISAKALLISRSYLISSNADSTWCSSRPHHHPRHFSSNYREESENDEEDEETVGEDSDGQEATSSDLRREYSADEKEEEAAAIGCKVIGPLQKSDRVFKPYEPVFAVVQIGSHQLKLILYQVLLLGSSAQTVVGRPTVLDAVVHAVVEEHALDAKVIIFKFQEEEKEELPLNQSTSPGTDQVENN